MIKVYFDGIRKQILSELDNATQKISVAVYWFTNEALLEKLMNKLDSGLSVEVIIHNDYINNRESGLPFQGFINKGGKFYFSNSEHPMHNKFCIIDDKVVINGSYNWTYYAEDKNRENVLVIKDEQTVLEEFSLEFERLKSLTNLVDDIRVLTKFEVDEFNQLKARDYLANDIIYRAKDTGRNDIVDEAFQLAPGNIEVQQRAVDLSLTKKWRLKHSIGTSLMHDRYLIIVPKGKMLPFSDVKIVQTVSDNQRSSAATIHYGENTKASLNKQFAEIELMGLPPKPAGEAKIKYTVTVDIYGVLRIEKMSLDNGRCAPVTKKITGLLEEILE
ncbi:phospholipase D-like domain-containing protein [Hymenobacter baengnokdamensis]|uniref:phospholipase D-like domain-containing protein n=1 Tax=Hymenobacter baengnokdamensis TaxID=2615203 RepID=UPI001243D2C4|nr:phospholipase D-like domain-containing protein [Hymenobacter baengnokdamensis]